MVGAVSDGTSDTKRLIDPDRRHVEPWRALEPAGERDPEDRGSSDVAVHLVGAESGSQCSRTFVDRSRRNRGADAVERANEVTRIEAAAGYPSVQCVTDAERGVPQRQRESASGGHLHIVRPSGRG